MAQISDSNTENHPQEDTPPSDSTAVCADVPAAELPDGLPSRFTEATVGLSARLQDLTERARGYVEAASSANTRRAYASDWKHFTTWCRRQNPATLPARRKSSSRNT